MRKARGILLLVLLLVTWVVVVLHRAVLEPPSPSSKLGSQSGRWYPKAEYGINQLFVYGAPYGRGLSAGSLTKDLMYQEEVELISRLKHAVPNRFVRGAFLFALMRWFWGIESYFDYRVREEMYGVSKSASPDFNYLLDPYTRQLAYHGLHEVGQMFVDAASSDRGCTLFAIPAESDLGKSWVIGRNFDFEGGPIFDDEKIVKWVTPERGFRFVSVIWAGMVGAVTGVNEHGVYVSINAAGSSDWRRYGTPTTLLVKEALQFSTSAAEAVDRIVQATTFITDIFVVADETNVLIVEKSPEKVSVTPWTKASVVTNHLLAPLWRDDTTNLQRRKELTTESRYARGEALVSSLANRRFKNTQSVVPVMLNFLRDKKSANGQTLPLGNRAAIDSLIAAHSVIYDSGRRILYVSQGPSLAGSYLGYDLAASFRSSGPAVRAGELPKDPEISVDTYRRIKKGGQLVEEARNLIEQRHCAEAEPVLAEAYLNNPQDYGYFTTLGDFHACSQRPQEAKIAWQKALALFPAYASERRALEKRLK